MSAVPSSSESLSSGINPVSGSGAEELARFLADGDRRGGRRAGPARAWPAGADEELPILAAIAATLAAISVPRDLGTTDGSWLG